MTNEIYEVTLKHRSKLNLNASNAHNVIGLTFKFEGYSRSEAQYRAEQLALELFGLQFNTCYIIKGVKEE